MSLKERMVTFVLSEEGAISKSAVLGIGAALGVIALAATPASAGGPCGCFDSGCGPWQFDHYCYGGACWQEVSHCENPYCTQYRTVCQGGWFCGGC